MKFEHKVVVAASREEVTAFLHDVPAVAACVPGLEDVREVEPELFEGRVRVKIGPLGLNIAGRGRVRHPEGEGAWRVEGEGRDGRAGSGVRATVEAHLRELAPSSTEVSIVAEVHFSGRLGELGQPLIRRKADSTILEFAENLKRALER